MSVPKTNIPTISRIKQRAKKLKNELGISHTEALTLISADFGFESWASFKNELVKNEQSQHPTPSPTTIFVEYDDVEMSNGDFESLDKERTNDLPVEQKKRVTQNKKQLTKVGVEFSLFEPTITGLKKSILDATQTVRTHFELEGFHFYGEQSQGPDNKVMKDACFLTDDKIIPSKASLYRPKTKKGDPRMWFKGLPAYANPGDQIAIIIHDGMPHLINLTTSDIERSLTQTSSFIKEFLKKISDQHNSVANELLAKIKEIAKFPFPALRKGDTAIGYTLETMLGIDANSSKEPDYKGIELKSGRGTKNRTTLFAQVADWSKSPCKKSAEILNKYGYERGDDFKLYCTVTTQRENSQGLSFIYDQSNDELQEWHNKQELVAVWPGELLRKRLKEKHAETFWVEAKSEIIDGVEHFQIHRITHTRSPIASQLMPLIQSGVITMDHLIKRNTKGRVSEKGPLFKMNKSDLELLFPEPITYQLLNIEG
ncbi:MvaI/BcnI family restriction endonuclease [Vibrio sp. Vb0932]|uniref:MvaI/BcnI family restriction endonuclease n=2 Tax=unclassified Vibrio TaxID=2614977 RepID=UPI0029672AC5|nr:MvaI/BcnI family restriction endonuclease [Vibrio sp. Vb0932]MDW3188962.1 MvaI/BcnI family restriction endonuclease [Vibrio sp. Vb0932]